MIKKLTQSNKGAIIVFVALLLPMFFTFIGFAVDTGQLCARRAWLQNIADSAAMGGIMQLREAADNKGETQFVLALPDEAERQEDTSVPDAGADLYLRKNSDNVFTIQQKGTRIFTSLYKTADKTNEYYYYKFTISENVPLTFMRIIGVYESAVGAEAIALWTKPKPTKDWYHMFHWELALIPAEERLTYDQHALLNMAALFIGRTPKQALKIINPVNPQANESHIKNGKEILILNYQDKQNDDTYIETFIGFNDTRSPQAINWSRDDFGEYDESLGYIPLDTYDPELGWFEDMRFFFSDWILQDWPDVDSNKRTFRISFKLDENGLISEARVRVNRKRNYLYELDMTVRNDGYTGQTFPGISGAYTDNAL